MPKHSPLPYHLYVNVDNSYLGALMPTGVTKGIWHGIYCREYQVLSCHVFLESGANWSGLPIHALSTTTDFSLSAEQLMPWCGMGEEIEAISMPFLEGLESQILKPQSSFGRHTGIIIDWKDGYSRYPQEHKPLNLIETENGQYALLPNNYVVYKDKHFVEQDAKRFLQFYRRGEDVYWEKS
jgi:hypothetical protein